MESNLTFSLIPIVKEIKSIKGNSRKNSRNFIFSKDADVKITFFKMIAEKEVLFYCPLLKFGFFYERYNFNILLVFRC